MADDIDDDCRLEEAPSPSLPPEKEGHQCPSLRNKNFVEIKDEDKKNPYNNRGWRRRILNIDGFNWFAETTDESQTIGTIVTALRVEIRKLLDAVHEKLVTDYLGSDSRTSCQDMIQVMAAWFIQHPPYEEWLKAMMRRMEVRSYYRKRKTKGRFTSNFKDRKREDSLNFANAIERGMDVMTETLEEFLIKERMVKDRIQRKLLESMDLNPELISDYMSLGEKDDMCFPNGRFTPPKELIEAEKMTKEDNNQDPNVPITRLVP
jgi:hypothetical protein